jgi:hypothetical protein
MFGTVKAQSQFKGYYEHTPCLVTRLSCKDGTSDAEVCLVGNVGAGAEVCADTNAFQNCGECGERRWVMMWKAEGINLSCRAAASSQLVNILVCARLGGCGANSTSE